MNFSFKLFFLMFLLFLNFPSAGDTASPRLLITLGSKCNFTAEKLASRHGAIVVKGKKNIIKKKIIELDRTSSNHLIVLKNNLKDLYAFSYQIGYATLHLNCNLEEASTVLKETLKTIPTTSQDLPAWIHYL